MRSLAAGLIALLQLSVVAAATDRASGPVTWNGHTYYLLESSSWQDAEAAAVALGGHLVTINDASEDAFVYNTFAGYGGVARALWIGLTDEAEEGTFVWISGEPSAYRNWELGEPNNDRGNPLGEEDYAHIYPPGPFSSHWNDVSGLSWSGPLSHGVVEVDGPSEWSAVLQDPSGTTFVGLFDNSRTHFSPAGGGGSNGVATNTIAITQDGSRAAVTNAGGRLQIYDLTGTAPLALATYAEQVYPSDVDITPDGRFVVLQDPAGTTFFALADGSRTHFSPPGGGGSSDVATNAIAVSRDSSRAAVTNAGGRLQIYDLTGVVPTVAATYAEQVYPSDVDITPDGRFVVLQDPAGATFIALADGSRTHFSPPGGGGSNGVATNTIAITPDGSRAAITNAGGRLQIYDLTGTAPTTVATYAEQVYPSDLDITPDGRFVVLQDPAGTTFIRLLDGNRTHFSPPGGGGSSDVATNTIAVSRDSSRAAVTNAGGRLQIYDLTGAVPIAAATYAEQVYPSDVDITPDGRFVVLQDPAGATFIALADGSRTHFSPQGGGGSNAVATNTIAITPDSSHAAITNAGGRLQIYDLTGTTPTTVATYAEQVYPSDVDVLPVRRSVGLSLTGSAAPEPVGVGQNLTYSFVAINNGPAPATAVRVIDRLPEDVSLVSASATQGSCTTDLAVICNLGSMPVGGTATVTVVVRTAGAGTLLNTAYVGATERDWDIDANTASVVSKVAADEPWLDLVETAVSAPPSTASPGGKFTVTDIVTNIGTMAAAATTTRYYLSLDAVTSANDVLLSAKRAVVALPAGQASIGSKAVTIPGALALGSYYVLACADDLRKVQEQDDSNNCLASSSPVRIDWPDLSMASLGNPPLSATAGGAVTVADTVTNQGFASAGASSTRYYLSLNGIKDATDVLLTGARSIASLAPGASSSGTKKVKVPAGTVPGNYFVLACADDLNKVGESANEGNNCRASATTINLH